MTNKLPDIMLYINHNIYLTHEQRYQIIKGETLEVMGVFTPIWVSNTVTSEPGVEVFNKYFIGVGEWLGLSAKDDLYHIKIPLHPIRTPNLPEKIWTSLSEIQQNEWLANNTSSQCLQRLRDITDGGTEYIIFQTEFDVDYDGKKLHIIHLIEVKKMEELLETLC